MKEQVTFGNVLTILGILIIPLVIWGVSIEKRFETVLNNTKEIQYTKSRIQEIETSNNDNFKKLYDIMVDIKLELKDKRNRDN